MSHEVPGSPERKEEMVEAVNISTVFTDAKLLEKIADDLMSRGIISGFSVEPIRAGYIYEGKKTEEDQFELSILAEENNSDKIEEIKQAISEAVSPHWDVPKIEQRTVKVNSDLLTFVRRAGIEHKKYLSERNKKLSLALAAFLSVSGIIGTFIHRYTEEHAQEAVKKERVQELDELKKVEDELGRRIDTLNGMLNDNRPLTSLPNDMSVTTAYKETDDVEKVLKDAREKLEKIINSEKQ